MVREKHEHTSRPPKTLPSHSCLHFLATSASLNFMSTRYRFILPVITIRKWLTSSLVFSPTQPKKSLGVMYEGTAGIQRIVVSRCPSDYSSALHGVCWAPITSFRIGAADCEILEAVPNPGVSSPSRYKCTIPQPNSVFFSPVSSATPVSSGSNLAFVV